MSTTTDRQIANFVEGLLDFIELRCMECAAKIHRDYATEIPTWRQEWIALWENYECL